MVAESRRQEAVKNSFSSQHLGRRFVDSAEIADFALFLCGTVETPDRVIDSLRRIASGARGRLCEALCEPDFGFRGLAT